MDALDRISQAIGEEPEFWRECPSYFFFEGWDVGPRPKDILDQAIRDGVDLNAEDMIRCVGPAPHPFQNGFLLSEVFCRGVMASNQSGKTLGVAMEIQMSASGKIPIAYRYPAGHDTGVQRLVTAANVARFGRRSKDTGEVIDFNIHARPDDSWDCGNIMGLGIFPSSKIVEAGSSIRIGTYQKNVLENWWPAFTGRKRDGMGAFVNPAFLDRSRGSHGLRGSNKQDYQIFLVRDVTLQMLTYESGAEKFEGIKVTTHLDEEPPDEAIIGAVVTHSNRWSITETPYFGITYTKALLFPPRITPDLQTFHATAYDCPYLSEADIRKQRNVIGEKMWEVGARLWGVPTEQSGKPYYDRNKINLWMQRFCANSAQPRLVRFEPVEEWGNIRTDKRISNLPGLLDTPVRVVDAQQDDQRAVWRLYKDRQPGVGYVSASDQAEGAEVVGDAGDLSVAVIGCASEDDPTRPVIAATLRSTLPTPQFAREALYGARYFNNALLAPETGPGAANESFRMVACDWPWWFKDATIRQSTRKSREQMGFRPTSDRRDAVFNKLIRDWLDSYEQDQYPDIPDEWILRELAGAVSGSTRGGKARCDHPRDGTLDSAMAFGILLFVFQAEFMRQIKCHSKEAEQPRRVSWLDEALMARAAKNPNEPSVVFLGDNAYAGRGR